jgi:hypothetical protein
MMQFSPESNYFILVHTVYSQTPSNYVIQVIWVSKFQIHVHVKQVQLWLLVSESVDVHSQDRMITYSELYCSKHSQFNLLLISS